MNNGHPFGEIYLANDAKTGEEVAVKLVRLNSKNVQEKSKTKHPQLLYETKLYKIL